MKLHPGAKKTELVAAYRAALHSDFVVFYERCFATLEPGTEFRDNWHIHAIAEALRRVRAGETTRLIINVPPRSGKSTLVSIAFTAWLLGHDPRLEIICVSFSEDLARTHAAAFRAIVKCDWYKKAFPAFQIQQGGDRSVETVTTERGFRYAVSISGSVMGRNADVIIADDALGPDAVFSDAVRMRQLELWDMAHRTRLNDKQKGAIISISQRLHERDLVGHLLASGTWQHLIIPAVANEAAQYEVGPRTVYNRPADELLDPIREPQAVLDEMRLVLGSMQFSAQYMQEPLPPMAISCTVSGFATMMKSCRVSRCESLHGTLPRRRTIRAAIRSACFGGLETENIICWMLFANVLSRPIFGRRCSNAVPHGSLPQPWSKTPNSGELWFKIFGAMKAGASSCGDRSTTRKRASLPSWLDSRPDKFICRKTRLGWLRTKENCWLSREASTLIKSTRPLKS